MRIISKWGVGIDGIDLEAAHALGIPVVNTPGVFGGEVADVALGYVVMLARQLHRIDASVKAGGWFKHEGRSLERQGAGSRRLREHRPGGRPRGKGFGMRVVAHDVANVAAAEAMNMGVEMLDRDGLFRQSDFLVLCSPLTPETRHIGQSDVGLMQPGSYLVNVGRGSLVDESRSSARLSPASWQQRRLTYSRRSRFPAGSGLRRFPQCVFGSHNASNTREGVLRTSARAVDNL